MKPSFAVNSLSYPGRTLDFDRYTAYVKGLEGFINPDTVDVQELDAILQVIEVAAEIADLYKKKIVYGRKDMRMPLLAASIALRRAQQRMDEVVYVTGRGIVAEEAPIGNKDKLHWRLLHAAIGAFGEWGEILHAIRKSITTGTLDMVNIKEELGDAGFYDAAAHDSAGIEKHESMDSNKAKLDVRFGGGKSFHQAVNFRNLVEERKALEGEAPPEAA